MNQSTNHTRGHRMHENWEEKAVFLAALAIPPGDRPAFLDGACPDPDARARIEALLRHHERTEHAAALEPTTTGQGQTRFGEFQVLRKLGEGGMGIVYHARDTVLQRDVALKVLSGAGASSELALAKFRNEARSTAALQHPGIIPVYKLGVDGTTHYIISQFVDGPTLAQLIKSERDARTGASTSTPDPEWPSRAARVTADIAEALECAHRAGIIHRDVKPSNILIPPDGRAKLADFGIAKNLASEDRTLTGEVLGSVHYMSPEQAQASEPGVDARSDVYSLGVALYEALALRRPFEGSDPAKVIWAVLHNDPPHIRSVEPAIPKALATICHKALEKQPLERYQSAAHLEADLRSFLEGKPILAKAPGPVRRLHRWAGRRRGSLAAAGALLAILAVTAIAWVGWNLPAEDVMPVSIVSQPAGSLVLLQRLPAGSFTPEPIARPLGKTPIHDLELETGLYRFTIVAPHGAFAECDVRVLDPGRDRPMRIEAYERRHSLTSEPRADAEGDAHPTRLSLVMTDPRHDRLDMVCVPAGDYRGGWAKTPDADESVPSHNSHLAAFLIDPHEVTNAEYRVFIQSTGRPPPPHWTEFGYDHALAQRPVVGVTLDDAESFARWAGKRLPTADEWEAATRGESGDLYPASPAPALSTDILDDAALARSTQAASRVLAYAARTSDVSQSEPWADAGGLTHAHGNVSEWTASFDIDTRSPAVRGRAWTDDPRQLSLASRMTHPWNRWSLKLGFRCARSYAPPPSQDQSTPDITPAAAKPEQP